MPASEDDANGVRTLFVHRVASDWTRSIVAWFSVCTIRSASQMRKRSQLIDAFSNLVLDNHVCFFPHFVFFPITCSVWIRCAYTETEPTKSSFHYSSQAQCTGILEAISRQVNNQHSELAAHRLLSIFKMAEVQVVWPEVSGAAAAPLADLGRLSVRLAVLVVGVPIALRWLQLRDMDVRSGWVSWCAAECWTITSNVGTSRIPKVRWAPTVQRRVGSVGWAVTTI